MVDKWPLGSSLKEDGEDHAGVLLVRNIPTVTPEAYHYCRCSMIASIGTSCQTGSRSHARQRSACAVEGERSLIELASLFEEDITRKQHPE